MNLKSILVCLLFNIPLFTYSQSISFGVKGGLNLSKDKLEIFTERTPLNIITEVEPSFHFGALLEFLNTDKITSFQMEILYTGNGTIIRENDFSPAFEINVNQITVPLLLKIEATRDWNLTSGSYLGYILNAEEKNRFGESTDTKSNFQQFDFGLLFGFELKLNTKLAFDVRYNHGLLNFNNSTIFDGNETERIYKNRTVNYGAVYKF